MFKASAEIYVSLNMGDVAPSFKVSRQLTCTTKLAGKRASMRSSEMKRARSLVDGQAYYRLYGPAILGPAVGSFYVR